MSWVGPARELLYGACESERTSEALWNLTQGYHEVKMIGWLPGITEVSGTESVFIKCK
jgi:hypothetical protein